MPIETTVLAIGDVLIDRPDPPTIFANVADWFAELDRLGGEPFMVDGRHQPRTPEREIFTS